MLILEPRGYVCIFEFTGVGIASNWTRIHNLILSVKIYKTETYTIYGNNSYTGTNKYKLILI